MKHLLSIGKFAALCETTTDTLIHYDNVGLLVPVYISETHRRFYDIQQYYLFCTIQHLTSIGTPLCEIKTLLYEYSLSALTDNLREKEQQLQKQLNHLKNTISYINTLQLQAEQNQNTIPNQPYICQYHSPRHLFATLAPYPCHTIMQFSEVIRRHIKICEENNLYPFPLGIISKRRGQGISENRPLLLTSPPGNIPPSNKTPIKQSGEYAIFLHNGNLNTLKDSVSLLYHFIEKNEYLIAGDTFISLYNNGSPFNREPIYIIEIPICKT